MTGRWDWRLFEHSGGGEAPLTVYSIRETFYNSLGDVQGWTERAASLGGYEGVMSLREDLVTMLTAFEQPIIRLDSAGTLIKGA